MTSSGFVCPNPKCRKPLHAVRGSLRDLFCEACGVAVALIDEEDGIWLTSHGETWPCKVDDLKAPDAT